MTDLSFKFQTLTFINSRDEVSRQIRNTAAFSYVFKRYGVNKALDELLDSTQYGYNAPASDIGEHKFLRISDIKEGAVSWDEVPFCDCGDFTTYKLYKNDVLVARTGGTTGKSFLITDPPGNAVYAGYLIRLRANEDVLLPEYLYAFLNNYSYWNQVISMKKGSAQPNVNAKKLRELKIPYCDIEQQKEIIQTINGFQTGLGDLKELLDRVKSDFEKLNTIDDTYYSQQTLLSQLRQAILQEAVSGQLTAQWRSQRTEPLEPASELLARIKAEKERLIQEKKIKKEKPLPPIAADEIPYELPEGWVWCRLVEITSILGDGIHGTPEYTENGDFYFVNGNNLSEGSIVIKTNTKTVSKEEYLKHQRPLNDRTVLVSINGTIGNVAFYSQEKVMLGKSACYFNLFSDIDKSYIRRLIETNYFLDYVTTSATGTTIKNVSLKTMRMLLVPLPPLAEQQAIVAQVNRLMALCDQLEAQLTQSQQAAQQLMQALLQEAFAPKEELPLGMVAEDGGEYK